MPCSGRLLNCIWQLVLVLEHLTSHLIKMGGYHDTCLISEIDRNDEKGCEDDYLFFNDQSFSVQIFPGFHISKVIKIPRE